MTTSNDIDGLNLFWWGYQIVLTGCVALCAWLFKVVFKSMATKTELVKSEQKMAEMMAQSLADFRAADHVADEQLIQPIREQLTLLLRLRDSDRSDQDRRHSENLQAFAVLSGDVKQLIAKVGEGRTPGH